MLTSVGQNAMLTGKSVLDEKWAGSEQEERDNIVTEVRLVHDVANSSSSTFTAS